jgi:DNA repair exonuclease SbcCD ATPase subunit
MTDPLQHEAVHALEAALTTGWSALEATEAALAEEAAQAREQLDRLLGQLSTHRQKTSGHMTEAVARLEAFKAHLQEQAAAQAQESSTLSEIRAALREAKEQAEQAEARAAQFESDLAAAREAGTAHQAELAQLREDGAGGVAALEAQVQDLQARLEAKTAEAAQLRSEVDQLRSEADQLRGEAAERLSAADADALRQQVEIERERAEELAQRLEAETARGTKAVLAEQLTDALREAERLRDALRQAKSAGAAAHPRVAEVASESMLGSAALTQQARILDAAAKRKDAKRTIGDILLDAGLLTREQLDDVQEEFRKNPQTFLGRILVEKGYATEDAVAQALAAQCNAPLVSLRESPPASDAIHRLPARLAHQHCCIPLRISPEDALIVAIANPLDLVAIEDIERSSNGKVEVAVAAAGEIRAALAKHYDGE